MTQVLWCNTDDPETNAPHQIGHSFPDSDPDRRKFEETKVITLKTGNSYGNPVYQDHDEVTTTINMCGYHWSKLDPFRAQATPKAEILAKNESYNQGWEDARKHFEA